MTTEELRNLHTEIPEEDILELALLIEPQCMNIVHYVQDNTGFLTNIAMRQRLSQVIAKIALAAMEVQKRGDT